MVKAPIVTTARTLGMVCTLLIMFASELSHLWLTVVFTIAALACLFLLEFAEVNK